MNTHYIDNEDCEWIPVYQKEDISFEDFTDECLEQILECIQIDTPVCTIDIQGFLFYEFYFSKYMLEMVYDH